MSWVSTEAREAGIGEDVMSDGSREEYVSDLGDKGRYRESVVYNRGR